MSNNPRERKNAESGDPSSFSSVSEPVLSEPERTSGSSGTIDPGIPSASSDAIEGEISAETVATPEVIDGTPSGGSNPTPRTSKKLKMADPDAEKDKRKDPAARKERPRRGKGVVGEEGTESHTEDRERKRKRKRIFKIIRRVIYAILFLALFAILFAFALYRWSLYDDAQAIQGQWIISSTGNEVTITDKKIQLTEDVAYDYILDPDTKTVVFTFGNLSGSAHYRFSLDRKQLMIEDGEFDWWGSTLEDAAWLVPALKAKIMDGIVLPPGDGENGALVLSLNEE